MQPGHPCFRDGFLFTIIKIIMSRGFASDNNSGIHPEIFRAIEKANSGHVTAYGDDIYTARAIQKFREHFGHDTNVYFTLTGTGSNIIALAAAADAFNSVICAVSAHINVDECGAPERFIGCKLLPVQSENGKLTVKDIENHMDGIGFEHHSQPKIISISQSTELGTVYKPEEIRKIAEYAHRHNMFLHMDGARLANAAAYLNLSLRAISGNAGVDILSFGGTKNGLLFAESVVVFNNQLSSNLKYIRKQASQLASKMRFIAVQFEAYLSDDLWLKNARRANEMAQLLYNEVSSIRGIMVTQHVESNGVFAVIPKEIIPKLQEKYFFYLWNEFTSEVRWMTSYDSTKEDIRRFADALRELLREKQ